MRKRRPKPFLDNFEMKQQWSSKWVTWSIWEVSDKRENEQSHKVRGKTEKDRACDLTYPRQSRQNRATLILKFTVFF